MSKPSLKNKLWVMYFYINAVLSIGAMFVILLGIGYYVYLHGFDELRHAIYQMNVDMWHKSEDKVIFICVFIARFFAISLICANIFGSIAVFDALENEEDKKHLFGDKDKDIKSKSDTKKS